MPDQLPEIELEDHGSKGRYVLRGPGGTEAEMTFTKIGEHQIIIDHTEVSETLRGQGVARRLVEAAVGWARESRVKVIPLCPFAKAVFDREPSFHDVLG